MSAGYVEHLTDEEMELVKQFRKEKQFLNVQNVIVKDGCKVTHEMRFKMGTDFVTLNTSITRVSADTGVFYGTHGFYNTEISRIQAKEIIEFLNRFLS